MANGVLKNPSFYTNFKKVNLILVKSATKYFEYFGRRQTLLCTLLCMWVTSSSSQQSNCDSPETNFKTGTETTFPIILSDYLCIGLK
jgi:hypothetical protein